MAQPQLVGPGQAVPYLTNLGQQMTATPPPALIDAVLYAGPADYYKDDTGTHSGRWTGLPQAALWPQWDGPITVPFRLVAAPGARPVLTATPNSIYYGQGLFIIALPAGAAFPGEFYTHPVTGAAIPLGAIFKGLDFVGFTTGNGDGNQSGLRFDPVTGTVTPGVSVGVLVQDCLFTGCDNGVLGGAPGMTVIFDTCEAFGNGLGAGGLSHELYVGPVDELIVVNLFSHSTAGTGHLLKSRAARTTIVGPVRLLGLGGRESACLDVPDAGVLTIIGDVVMEKSATADADWTIHYSGENQDNGSVPVMFHQPSSVTIKPGLVLIGPPALTNHPSYPVLGFVDQSGMGAAQSGAGSAQVVIEASGVTVYGFTPENVGLPAASWSAPTSPAPALDTSSPLTTSAAAPVSAPATPGAPLSMPAILPGTMQPPDPSYNDLVVNYVPYLDGLQYGTAVTTGYMDGSAAWGAYDSYEEQDTCYVTPGYFSGYDPFSFDSASGSLVITSTPIANTPVPPAMVTPFTWISGLLATLWASTPGQAWYVEVEALLPFCPSIWAAPIWMIYDPGKGLTGPSGQPYPELDVEFEGQNNAQTIALSQIDSGGIHANYPNTGYDLTAGFHHYGLEYSGPGGQVANYFGGNKMVSKSLVGITDYDGASFRPHVALQMGCGRTPGFVPPTKPDFTTPQKMLLRSLRVWQKS